jgi:hypothetical protein
MQSFGQKTKILPRYRLRSLNPANPSKKPSSPRPSRPFYLAACHPPWPQPPQPPSIQPGRGAASSSSLRRLSWWLKWPRPREFAWRSRKSESWDLRVTSCLLLMQFPTTATNGRLVVVRRLSNIWNGPAPKGDQPPTVTTTITIILTYPNPRAFRLNHRPGCFLRPPLVAALSVAVASSARWISSARARS